MHCGFTIVTLSSIWLIRHRFFVNHFVALAFGNISFLYYSLAILNINYDIDIFQLGFFNAMVNDVLRLRVDQNVFTSSQSNAMWAVRVSAYNDFLYHVRRYHYHPLPLFFQAVSNFHHHQ